jgi:hypothetical protein
MRKISGIIIIAIFFVSFFSPFGRALAETNGLNAVGDTLNLAKTATITTSFVSTWEKLGAVNDGVLSTSSMIKPSVGAYGNWNNNYGSYNWVQYEWPKANKLLSTAVYWWIDNTNTPAEGISKPTDAYIEYWNGSAWIKFGNIGLDLNKFNSLNLGIMTSKIRINMMSGASTGIIEWTVTGVEGGECDPTVIKPFVTVNGGATVQSDLANADAGDSVRFSLQDGLTGGSYGWSGPESFVAATKSVTLHNLQTSDGGSYKVSFTNECGSLSSCYFHLTVRDTSLNVGDVYSWPSYNPTLNYNFRDEFPSLSEPTKDLNDCTVKGTISSGWWTFKWGPKANTLVDSTAVLPMLARMNKDFAYFRDTLGWPPDKRAENGYRSAIYLYGSGLVTDNASNTDLGGWQSAITYANESWPMVLLSYYPVYSFSPKCTYSDKVSQQGAVVHEGIHSVLANLPGCKNSAWFQEGGNTWLQQEAEVRRTGNYSGMGFLNVGSFIAPFMPIECYSGWLQDGSFGGPSAEGVNMFSGSTQICTWKNLLGGVQYSNIFPVFLGLTLGSGSVAWIWRNCESRVLEGMAKTLGEVQMRRLISEYRAKQAVLDMGKWTTNMKSLLNSNMGVSIKSEWSPYWINCTAWSATPYVKTTDDGNGLLTPEARTLPGWSGGNQIPLVASGDEVTVNFQPIGRNMTCQLCFRTKSGEIVYSQIVNGGDCSLKLDKKPANNVLFAVIANTDYIYEGDTTRKSHFDYRLQLVKGLKSTKDISKKWYDWTLTMTPTDLDNINITDDNLQINTYPNPVSINQPLYIDFDGIVTKPVNIEIINLNGQLLYKNVITGNTSINIENIMKQGVYLLSAEVNGIRQNRKLIVK